MEANDIVLFDVADGIAEITLNRPERRNALSVAAAERLHDLWETVDARDDIRVVILTAAACGTFCAGMDLKEASELRQSRGVDVLTLLRDPFHQRMRAVRVPIIAAMTGHFAAGGFMLSLNADIRVGLSGTRGGITETKRGRGSPWAMPLLWQLPQPMLMEMVLTGDLQPIERLHALGFVNHVEPDLEAVRARARVLAETIRDNAPLSVMAGKQSILKTMDVGCAAGLEHAQQIYEPVYASEDAQEGPRAFAEKRQPVWKGR
ncbi:enoyl-CoA hydratase/isomerase family protein [Marivibrio halodurans]|uniref:Enoyl-CoA hydratase/isomerase family protein n=1 Tax=Marivibrio halodurans TaxID=2039722 RepID=A0A8J7V2T5_9PROT|nr:enoyl-CoA hydratase-related protein [Marivibrio halodurans]MBP5857501.1 enoyl-CoA hydratase/isomerase family protein [Marivibrio halodurans]